MECPGLEPAIMLAKESRKRRRERDGSTHRRSKQRWHWGRSRVSERWWNWRTHSMCTRISSRNGSGNCKSVRPMCSATSPARARESVGE
uniref:Uncharacterized protein n=1 Tax=Mycetohabitans sp. TaxID=2571162 RepID=A0A6B9HDN9_9BURK|nr:hypothetical protein [Mycetohabitans sp.]